MQASARRVTCGAADHHEESEKEGQESVRELHTSRPDEGCQPLEEGVTARPPRHGAVSGGQMAGHSVLFTTQKCRWIRPVIRTTRDRAGGRKNYLAMEQICVSQIVPILF